MHCQSRSPHTDCTHTKTTSTQQGQITDTPTQQEKKGEKGWGEGWVADKGLADEVVVGGGAVHSLPRLSGARLLPLPLQPNAYQPPHTSR
eukprot:3735520-Rhodomonas_salina.1